MKREINKAAHWRAAQIRRRLARGIGGTLAAGIAVCLGLVFWRNLARFVSSEAASLSASPTAAPTAEPGLTRSPAIVAPEPENAPSPKYEFSDGMLECAAKEAAGIEQSQDMTLYEARNLVKIIQVVGNIPFPTNDFLIINDGGGYDYYSNGTKIEERGPIASLEDLRQMSGMRELFLSFQRIEDLEPISALPLTRLDLDNNNIRSVSPLSNMTSLKELYLSANPLEDIGALSKLTELEKLDLCATPVKDVSVIKNLPKLRTLLIRCCPVTRLPDLTDMRYIEEMSLAGVPLEDFTPVREYKGWISLDLSFTQMDDPLDIRYPSDLTFYNIGGTWLKTLSGIEDFTSLRELWVHYTDLNALDGVEALEKLEKLHMHYTNVKDITPLADLENLVELDIGYSSVKDLTPLLNRKRPLTIICPGLPESVIAPMVNQPNIILDR